MVMICMSDVLKRELNLITSPARLGLQELFHKFCGEESNDDALVQKNGENDLEVDLGPEMSGVREEPNQMEMAKVATISSIVCIESKKQAEDCMKTGDENVAGGGKLAVPVPKSKEYPLPGMVPTISITDC